MSKQLQIIQLRYTDETKLLRLKPRNNWPLTKGSKRGRLEIIAEILVFCDHEKAKTNIMYHTNLNYAQLKIHLKSLTTQGLLTTREKMYSTTEKGYRFLELFAQLTDVLQNDNT